MKPEEYKELQELYNKNLVEVDQHEVSYLLKYINESDRLPSNKTRRAFYASDATKCERALAWAVTGVPKSNPEYSVQTLNIFALGDAVHEIMEDRYRKIPGWKFYPEHPGEINVVHEDKPEFLLSYRVDGVLLREDWARKDLFGLETDKFVCEFKTIADFPYKVGRNRQKEVYWYGAEMVPKLDHFAQLQMGMAGEGAEYGILHYHNKNNGSEAIHVIRADQDYINNMIDRLWAIQIDAQNGKIPDRPFSAYPNKNRTGLMKSKTVDGEISRTAWQCTYCDWRDKCWELNEFKVDNED